MFKVKLNEKVFNIEVTFVRGSAAHRSVTYCTIWWITNGKKTPVPLGSGISICNPVESTNYKAGEKEAFKKALSHARVQLCRRAYPLWEREVISQDRKKTRAIITNAGKILSANYRFQFREDPNGTPVPIGFVPTT
jgi:hypothetical protein